MSTTISRGLQARNLISCAIQSGTPNSSGVITWGTAIELSVADSGTLTFDAFELRLGPLLEKFVPSDTNVANYQIEHNDWTAVLREMTPQTSIGALMTVALGGDLVRIVAIYGAPGALAAAQTQVVVIGIRDATNFGIAAGRNVQELTIRPIGYNPFVDDAAATPTI